jgi:hypothetical protein
MSTLVSDCPRCGTNKITFDLRSAHQIDQRYNWQRIYETFCVCRHCSRSTIFVVSQNKIEHEVVFVTNLLNTLKDSVNTYVQVEGYVSAKDDASAVPPAHVPEEVKSAFAEGATCLATGCNNAAATMFRLCVDLATRQLLPKEDLPGLNAKTRKNLGLRLPWLFDNKILREDLRDLSSCIKDDGNDGAHAGNLRQEDAQDICEFTYELLGKIYTENKKIELAKERRLQRRKEQT